MYISIEKDIASLLFSYGHIDNNSNIISKEIQKNDDELLRSIEKRYKIESCLSTYSTKIKDRTIHLNEFIKVIERNSIIVDTILCDTQKDDIEDIAINAINILKLKSFLYTNSINSKEKLNLIKAKLIIVDISDYSVDERDLVFTNDDLYSFFTNTVETYIDWIFITEKWAKKRDESIKKISFPFPKYREGQEYLAKSTYRAISQEKCLFAQAVTGTGKTISIIFSSVKAIGEKKINKIFYLTAKTIGARVAEEAFDKMRNQGLKIRNISITAKEKVCHIGSLNCNPKDCKYAKNYYGKVNTAIYELLKNEENFTRDIVDFYSKKHEICPFELSLDLSLYSDAIICDYNYVFDLNVYLKRYFDSGQCSCVLLIDEAHNLIDRARSMYSAEISQKDILSALDEIKGLDSSTEDILRDIKSDIDGFILNGNGKTFVSVEFPSNFANKISKLNNSIGKLFKSKIQLDSSQKIKDLYQLTKQFIAIGDIFDDKYIFYVDIDDDTKVKLFCLDPSNNLSKVYKKSKSAVLFSATLSPLSYFRDILGGDKSSYGVMLQSPFNKKNREIVLVNNVSTKYKDRGKSYGVIADYISSIIEPKVGNYMVFFPSFEYLCKVKDIFNKKYPDIKTISQEAYMSELDREVYLSKFDDNPKETLVSFNVISGIFSEGVDLVGDRLIGSIIIGVGLPMICLERNLIKDYFQKKNGYGFDFSYTFPGMNKVIQSAGRVIRTDCDKGIIVLIDERFSTQKYKMLFPKEWNDFKEVNNSNQLTSVLKSFWKQHED